MSTKITRINEIAKERPNEVFTSIYHLINYELLLECYNELDGSKAVGPDKTTKEMYSENLSENLRDLVERLKRKGFRPSPARKVNIPKGNGKYRSLAIANFEDKIVQMAVKKIVEAIYEPKLPNNMFGFRTNKSCHKALEYLTKCVEYHCTNYILDADIKGFFDNIDHEKLMKCLEMHIKDSNLLRLIRRFLKAGIIDNLKYYQADLGTPQGSILSPVLANIFMYYAIINWTNNIKSQFIGYIEIINYADDFIVCFQHKKEVEKYYQMLNDRLKKCSLELAQDKTRLIEFGKFAIQNKKMGKPETFDFLGFTHYCSTSKKGKFRVKRKTARKKYTQKLKKFNLWLKKNIHQPLVILMDTIKRKLIGHYNYYGITDNYDSINKYFYNVRRLLFKWLNRRNDKKSYTSQGFNQMLEVYKLPKPNIKTNIYAVL